MTKRLFLCGLLSIPLLSCQNQTITPAPIIEPDKDVIELPAEFFNAQDTSFTITVKSNLSWYALVNDQDHPIDPADPEASIEWARIDLADHENLTKVEDEVAIRMHVKRNPDRRQRRGVLNFYAGGGVFSKVEIQQNAAVWYLSATAERDEALCSPDTLILNISSNIHWGAELLDETTADAKLSRPAGNESDTLSVIFAENFDLVRKFAKVRIFAEDCPDCILTLSQSEAIPYLRLDMNDFSGELAPDATEVLLPVKTNCSGLTAVLKDGCTLTDAHLEKVSETAFLFSFVPDGTDPYVKKTATVTISADGAQSLNLDFFQRGRLDMDFEANSGYTPALVTVASDEISYHSFVVGEHEYTLGLCKIYWRSGNKCIFYTKSGYLTFPAVEGLTLTKITLTFRGHTSNHSAKITIRGTGDDASTLYSPAHMNLFVPTAVNEYSTHTLVVGEGSDNKPAPGVSYMICQGPSSTCLLRHVKLQYE